MGIGIALKNILRNRKMTIKQLSEKSGISINTLYSITKRDSERVDEVILQRIADTLEIPVYGLTGIWSELDKRKIEVVDVYNLDGTPMSPERRKELETLLPSSTNSKLLYDGLSFEQKKDYWKMLIDIALDELNAEGLEKVADYSLDLSRISEYRQKQPETAPESTINSTEGKSTTPPSDVPETPPEGK